MVREKAKPYEGAAGCSVGCAKRGRLYFPIITLNNARTIRKAGMRTMREGPGGVRKVDRVAPPKDATCEYICSPWQRVWIGCAITAWNNHENTLRTAGMTAKN